MIPTTVFSGLDREARLLRKLSATLGIGCCTALMLLLCAVAVMDLRCVAVLTLLLTAEKLLPNPPLWRRLIGGALIVIALYLGCRLPS